MAFARAILPRLEPPGTAGVGLVPCAVGGTAIREWARGEHLYEQMVRRARAATECGEIEAVLWYQGESDAESDAETAAYQGNVERLIANIRADLGMPHLPFIQGCRLSESNTKQTSHQSLTSKAGGPNQATLSGLGHTPVQCTLRRAAAVFHLSIFRAALGQVALASGNKRNIEKVREAQLSINLLNVVTVDAIGLPLNEDNLHLTTEAQVKLGESLAQAYISNFLQATC
uniref:Sialate O-acetylesterase domain-containing protein n=1 Tax=Aegilops tauschii TaxID=37682 RepID=M8CD78_AEGTA